MKQNKSTPWGTLIGLLLILVIIVAGAYYAFTQRFSTTHTQPKNIHIQTSTT